jgi:uncharacterized protein (DUF58 family)
VSRRTNATADAAVPPVADLPRIGAGSAPAEVIRRLELTVTRRLDGLLQGDYRGLVPGHGSEPGETRRYQAGDDVRRIDWNVTARTVVPHVRETVADRELETWVCVDASASLGFGTAGCEKRDLSLAAVAAVGFLTTRGGNRIGAVLPAGGSGSAQRPAPVLPARSGRLHLQALLSTVHDHLATPTPGRTDLPGALERMGRSMRRRGLAVVVSDFLDSPASSPTGEGAWVQPLRALTARHEVLAVEVVDRRELALPDVGVVRLEDPETGNVVDVQTSDPRLRRRFAEAASAQRDAIAAGIRRAGADHLVLRTDRDWLVDLARFVAWRRQRVDALTRVRR